MQCPRCQSENPPHAKFCLECGLPVSKSASEPVGQVMRTGTPAHPRTGAPTAYTPKHLADKILTSRSALEGERKQVSVLFADVKGSMDLAEQVDPEAWHRIMDRFFAILADGVHRFEGTINQFTGDGIMALFGAPIAHEDHAQRACYAALALTEALRGYAEELKRSEGLSVAVRMGLNSGEVVVGKIGDDLRMDYTAQGHTVGLAARMEQLADPGRAYLTAHTAKLVEGLFSLRSLGLFNVKGVREPLAVYELQGVGPLRSRLEVSRARGFSRFVGRESEMAQLEAALAQAVDGNGHVIGIVADAGTGKSRLCFEFAQRCRARGIEVIVGAGVSHGKSIPFLPVLELLRGFCGVVPQDSGEEARRKIAGTLMLRTAGIVDDLPLLFDFLGVPDPSRPLPRMDPEAAQRQLFAVIKRIIQSRSSGGPSLLVLEDLQWIDAASAAALESLIEIVPSTRTLLVTNFRPEYRADWMRRSCYQQIPLSPLGDAALGELLTDLLGNAPALDDLRQLIRAHTAGNPFFLEEVVRSLFDRGVLARAQEHGPPTLTRPVTHMQIPPTVQAVLAARIDRLNEHEKAVVQTAAIIGKEFSEDILQRVLARGDEAVHVIQLPPVLRALIAAEFIYEEALYPEAVYAFKHPLTQEVAYRSQLSERRAHGHAAVARAIADLHPAELDERAALLAHHWEAAGDALEAARWHQRAAAWVGSRDRGEMLRHWQRVRALLETVPEAPEVLTPRVLARIQILHNGLFLGQSDEEATALFTEGLELATRLNDTQLRLWLLGDYAMARLQVGAFSEALAHVTEGLRLADASGDLGARIAMRVPLTQLLLEMGRLRESIAVGVDAEKLCNGDPDVGFDILGFSGFGSLLSLRGAALTLLGQPDAAARAFDRAIEIGDARKDAEVLHWAHLWSVFWCQLTGDAARALVHARHAAQLADAGGSAGLRQAALSTLGRAYVIGEQWAAAITALSDALDMSERLGHFTAGLVQAHLAEAYAGVGDPTRARTAADEALELTRRFHMPVWEIVALLADARVRRAADGAAAASPITAALDAATTLIRTTEARAYEPFVHIERATLARLCGDAVACQRHLQSAYEQFTAMGVPNRAEQVATWMRAQSMSKQQ